MPGLPLHPVIEVRLTGGHLFHGLSRCRGKAGNVICTPIWSSYLATNKSSEGGLELSRYSAMAALMVLILFFIFSFKHNAARNEH